MGYALTSLGGTLLHYLYDLTGKSVLAAPFSGVNESTWEHMKLFFWPAFVFALVESFFFRDRENFWCIKLRGILLGLVMIPVLFYTYNCAIKKSPDWLNIAIFFIASAIAFIYETRRFNKENPPCRSPKLAFAALCVIGVLFIAFTFVTPALGIFLDPVTGTYGII